MRKFQCLLFEGAIIVYNNSLVISVEAIIYLLLYKLYDCTFNKDGFQNRNEGCPLFKKQNQV